MNYNNSSVYYPLFFKQEQPKPKIYKIITTLTNKEKQINSKIKAIPYWEQFFDTFFSFELVTNLKPEPHLETDTSKEVVLLKFRHYPRNTEEEYNTLYHIQDYLFRSVEKLSRQEIIHLDICEQNIIMKNDIPLLKITNKCVFVKDIIDCAHMTKSAPLELYVIWYLMRFQNKSLSSANIYELLHEYESVHEYDGVKNRTEEGFDFLKGFINKPKEDVIQELLGYASGWNRYFVSLFFLKREKEKENNDLIKQRLLNETHMNPLKRQVGVRFPI
jgi:hypothetical protein